jgi:phosphoribosyl-AMP cyclohydrolase
LALAARPEWTAARQNRQAVHSTESFLTKADWPQSVDFAASLWLSCNKPAVPPPDRETERKDGAISAEDSERASAGPFQPRFDSAGLLTAVVQHAGTGEVLMVAFMDAEALGRTRETGLAHFHSRSRGKLWMKGETSGNVLRVSEVLVDCDQDALVLKALPEGPTCHTGARSCFYRVLGEDGLAPIEERE